MDGVPWEEFCDKDCLRAEMFKRRKWSNSLVVPECPPELCDYEVTETSLETRCYQVTITEDTGYRANE